LLKENLEALNMQIKYLHKNVYKLSRYSLFQEKLEHYRQRYEKPVKDWAKLKREGNSDVIAQEFSGISRASYFRYKARLKDLAEGIHPPTRRPRTLRSPTGEKLKSNWSCVYAVKIPPTAKTKLP
jgi:hypothetical protein